MSTIPSFLPTRSSRLEQEGRHSTRTHRPSLSNRELEVLQLVALGYSNRNVADQLCISEATVKKHLSNVMEKLDAVNRTQAVAHGRNLGVLR